MKAVAGFQGAICNTGIALAHLRHAPGNRVIRSTSI